jgi:hypothetical protein
MQELHAKRHPVEEFDSDMPELETLADKARDEEDEAEACARDLGSQDSTSESDDADKSDDSIVNDVIEYECPDHTFCVEYAQEVDAFLLRTLKPVSESKRERCAALAEVLCDHYRKQ